MDLTQDFVQNFVNLRENNKEGVLRGLINSLDTSNRIDLLGLLVAEGLAVLERRAEDLLNLASAPLMGETETETQRQQSAQAGMEQGGEASLEDRNIEARNRVYRQLGEAARQEAIFEDLSSRFQNLMAEDVSDNTNEESSSSNQLDVSVEVGDAPDLYQGIIPEEQASQLGESPDEGRRGLPRAFSMESEGDTEQVIDVLGNVNPMEQGDNRIDYNGLLPKKPKRTKRKKKKKKPYEDLIITQKKRLAKLQKMSEKLSKKMSKTKKKRRKKKVSDSY